MPGLVEQIQEVPLKAETNQSSFNSSLGMTAVLAALPDVVPQAGLIMEENHRKENVERGWTESKNFGKKMERSSHANCKAHDESSLLN